MENLPISHSSIYTRQSIDARSDFTSCQAQFEICRNYFKSQDNLIINILSVFAQFEGELIRNRIAEVRAALKRQGKRVGGAVPYGYDADPFTKQLVVNGEEARRVREMFTMAAEGKRPSEIARIASGRGWRTKVREGRRTGRVSGGNPWTARQVLATL